MSKSTEGLSYRFARNPGGRTDLILSRFDADASDFVDVAVLDLNPDRALDFMHTTVRELTHAIADAAQSVHCGDCLTCRNTRMVNEPKNGRDWRVHCPDCRPADHTGFPPVPQIGGGVA